MVRRYTVVTGYWAGSGYSEVPCDFKPEFFDIWYANTVKHCHQLVDIFVTNSNSTLLPKDKKGKWLDMSFNPGHVRMLDKGILDFPKNYCGYTLSTMLGGLLSYFNNSDMLYKEQDCLAFGNYVDIMYETMEKEGTSIIVGRPEHAANQGLEQSLFMIKRDMIIPFFRTYMSIDQPDAGVHNIRPERKWLKCFELLKIKHSWLPFGYGRARPKEFVEDETFYVQQVKREECDKLKEMGFT